MRRLVRIAHCHRQDRPVGALSAKPLQVRPHLGESPRAYANVTARVCVQIAPKIRDEVSSGAPTSPKSRPAPELGKGTAVPAHDRPEPQCLISCTQPGPEGGLAGLDEAIRPDAERHHGAVCKGKGDRRASQTVADACRTARPSLTGAAREPVKKTCSRHREERLGPNDSVCSMTAQVAGSGGRSGGYHGSLWSTPLHWVVTTRAGA
jgi:hypothetical protein